MNGQDLDALIAQARSLTERSPISVSRRSWVLGELVLRYPGTPKEELEKIADQAIRDMIREQNKKP